MSMLRNFPRTGKWKLEHFVIHNISKAVAWKLFPRWTLVWSRSTDHTTFLKVVGINQRCLPDVHMCTHTHLFVLCRSWMLGVSWLWSMTCTEIYVQQQLKSGVNICLASVCPKRYRQYTYILNHVLSFHFWSLTVFLSCHREWHVFCLFWGRECWQEPQNKRRKQHVR